MVLYIPCPGPYYFILLNVLCSIFVLLQNTHVYMYTVLLVIGLVYAFVFVHGCDGKVSIKIFYSLGIEGNGPRFACSLSSV